MEEPYDKDPASALLVAVIDTGLFISVHNCSINSRLEDWEGKELPGSLCPVPAVVSYRATGLYFATSTS